MVSVIMGGITCLSDRKLGSEKIIFIINHWVLSMNNPAFTIVLSLAIGMIAQSAARHYV